MGGKDCLSVAETKRLLRDVYSETGPRNLVPGLKKSIPYRVRLLVAAQERGSAHGQSDQDAPHPEKQYALGQWRAGSPTRPGLGRGTASKTTSRTRAGARPKAPGST
jgi:hypothetical protein